MAIIPIAEQVIQGFFEEGTSQNELDRDRVTKNFRTAITELFAYGALPTEAGYDPSLIPSNLSAVATSKRPLVPMVISLVPPDIYPSGEFTTTRIPAPQEVSIRLIKTQRNVGGRAVANVESVRAADQIVPDQGIYFALGQGDSFEVTYTFRTNGNTLASGQLPVTFEVSDPTALEVSDTGTVTLLRDLGPQEQPTVSLRALRQDGTVLTATVSVTSEPVFDAQEAPPLSPDDGPADNSIETLVSTPETLQEDYLETLDERYRALRDAGPQSETEINDLTTQLVEGRTEIIDTIARSNASIRDSRNPAANEEYLRRQVLQFTQLPPLIMYVNPSSFELSYTHVISDGNRGRDGFIIEHWGLELPSLSASGNIGGTYVYNPSNDGGGLTTPLRAGSASYQKFLSLYSAYRNNGYIYNLDRRISLIGSVKIFYGDTVYTGSFENFTIQESEEKPFDLTYSFSFRVRFLDRVLT